MDYRNDIRNIAIIAHVDHGKTTLVDALLKQSRIFRENQEVGELIMDSNALEREKGITIMAKNTAVVYKGVKINIIDTPGHADFSGEVERVISMADGALLLIDAAEGPMPQTKFVLRYALQKGLKVIVVFNKLDRSDAQLPEVIRLTQDLFLELAINAEQLDYPVLYAIGRDGVASTDPSVPGKDISPIFEAILANIGRIWRGKVAPRDSIVRIAASGEATTYQVAELFTFLGLSRQKVESAEAGDIIALTGVEEANIGDTIASPEQPEALPRIEIGEPTVEMTFGVNTSPFAGREGQFGTTRQLRERLYRELDTNLSLRVQDTDSPDTFLVKGRGELHLAILIETMRREGYELQVSKPEAITKLVNGKLYEPVEILTIDTKDKYIGILSEMLSKRQAKMADMRKDNTDNVRLVFHIPTKGLLGFRSAFLTATRGEGVMNTLFLGYEPWKGELTSSRSGVLVASEGGFAVTYGLNNAQERGLTFIDPGTQVYEGMIVGLNSRPQDIPINVCKEKKKTNIRASVSDFTIHLTPALKMSLEQSLDFIEKDELVEVTPQNIRLRKKLLSYTQRLRAIGAARRQSP